MLPRARPSATQRSAVLGGVIALHGLLLLLVLALHSPGQRVVKPAGMQLISIATDQAQEPPKPVMPSKVPAKPIPQAELAQAIASASAPAGMVGNCETLSVISKALLADPDAIAGVAAVPADQRSIADAIVVWNAGWSPAASELEAPLGTVRMLVEEYLREAPDSCLDEAIAGPRLIPIIEGDRTTLLAFGSGHWTWRQLLETPDAVPSGESLPGAVSTMMPAGHTEPTDRLTAEPKSFSKLK